VVGVEGDIMAMLALSSRRGRWQTVSSFAAALDVPRQTIQHYLRMDRGNIEQVAYRYQYSLRVRQTWATCAGTWAYEMAAVHRGWTDEDLFRRQEQRANGD